MCGRKYMEFMKTALSTKKIDTDVVHGREVCNERNMTGLYGDPQL